MTIRNAYHRPHCVDLSPGAFNSADSSRGCTSRPASKPAARQPRKSVKTVMRKPPARGDTRSGAVRINSVKSAQQPGFRLSNAAKLSTAVAMVIGGLAWTTVNYNAEGTGPAPEVVRASMPATTFFFDDAVDALTAHFTKDAALSDTTSTSDARIGSKSASQILMSENTELPGVSTPAGHVADAAFGNLTPLVNDPDTSKTVTLSPLIDHPSLAAVRSSANAPEGALQTVVAVAPGNTLSGILNDHGIKMEQMPKLLIDNLVKQYLSNLNIGQELEITQSPEGEFHSLRTRVGNDKRVTIRRSDNGFAVASIDLPIEKERVVTSGTIEQSLYLAAAEADLKQSTIMELADIFQWELDFAKDIRKGDQFSLVYDRLYRDGSYIGDGDILAAEFIRGGKTYRAIRFTTDDGVTGYYSPNGQSKRRTFMRHPVDVVRITSKFNPNRLHPVLHQLRAHRGVDYGSPYGSPIYATADGKVTMSGANGGYGNTVVLQHGQKFSTLYAHMSKIAEKSVAGTRVKQGDVIGYVGKTGRVTGTHLHYEFRVNGKQIDPLKVELPAAQPIDAKYLPELKMVSDEMSAQMRSVLSDIDQQVASATNVILPASSTQAE